MDTLVQELDLFEPPKTLDHDENLKFINLRAKFQRLRTENLKKTEAQEDKLCSTSKTLTARLMPVIERLFSLPEQPKDIWKNEMLPMLASANPSSHIKMTLGKMQVSRQMSKSVKETMLQVVESERRSLKHAGCKTADEAINFVIRHRLSVANLKEFPDLTNDHLKRLSEQCPQLKYLAVCAALQSLDLSGCSRLTDAGLVHLKELTALQSLNLSYRYNLTDEGLAHLKELLGIQIIEY